MVDLRQQRQFFASLIGMGYFIAHLLSGGWPPSDNQQQKYCFLLWIPHVLCLGVLSFFLVCHRSIFLPISALHDGLAEAPCSYPIPYVMLCSSLQVKIVYPDGSGG
jgi:hypothetical protein